MRAGGEVGHGGADGGEVGEVGVEGRLRADLLRLAALGQRAVVDPAGETVQAGADRVAEQRGDLAELEYGNSFC